MSYQNEIPTKKRMKICFLFLAWPFARSLHFRNVCYCLKIPFHDKSFVWIKITSFGKFSRNEFNFDEIIGKMHHLTNWHFVQLIFRLSRSKQNINFYYVDWAWVWSEKCQKKGFSVFSHHTYLYSPKAKILQYSF